MSEVEALRLQLEIAIAVGGLLFVALAVAVTVLWQRVGRAERRLDAREGKGVAGAIIAAVGANRVRRVPRRR